jgi:flagellar secretion chaperone FliS
MQGHAARGAQAYIQTHVNSRSPLELVVMLYEGLIRFTGDARSAIERRDLVAKRAAMSRALAVLAELQSTLNMSEGGDVAQSLDGLYTYMNGRLLDGSMKNDVAPLDETLKLAGTLREAWAEIAARGAAEPMASQARP